MSNHDARIVAIVRELHSPGEFSCPACELDHYLTTARKTLPQSASDRDIAAHVLAQWEMAVEQCDED